MEQKRKEVELIDIAAWEGRPEPRRRSREEILRRRKKRKRQRLLAGLMMTAVLFTGAAALILAGRRLLVVLSDVWIQTRQEEKVQEAIVSQNDSDKPEVQEDFLTVNPYSRPGETLPTVENIFIHYTANRGTSAAQNRSYFENLGITGETSASAHFVIGFDGEIIQCIPLDEIGYAVKGRNYDSISIECCYLDEDGRFTDATYQSLIELTAWLLKEYQLAPSRVLRHYDEGGKKCPLYYVDHEGEWNRFKQDIETYIL